MLKNHSKPEILHKFLLATIFLLFLIQVTGVILAMKGAENVNTAIIFSFISATAAITSALVSITIFRSQRETIRDQNAFSIAQRWDLDGVISKARDRIRPLLEEGRPVPSDEISGDDSYKKHVNDLTNFFWDVNRSICFGLATEEYLKEKFKTSFGNYMKIYYLYVNEFVRKEYSEAYHSLRDLSKRWKVGEIYFETSMRDVAADQRCELPSETD